MRNREVISYSRAGLIRARNIVAFLIACVVLFSCAVPPAATETKAPLLTDIPDDQMPVFAIETDGEGNELILSVEDEIALIEVHSQSGIGSATIVLLSGAPPQNIVMRMYLQGLEQFRLLYDESVLSASVSSSDISSVNESLISTEGEEYPLTQDSPLWLDIRVVTPEDNPGIPLSQGYFEITLPKEILHGGQRSFSIHWVDFFR